MRPEDRADYIVACLREAASMYEDGARAFLAEHDAEVRAKTLNEAATGQAPAPEGKPDFFQIGRTYTHGATPWRAPELIAVFRPEHVTVHPEHGFRRAIGWVRTGEPGAKWHGHFVDEAEFSDWTETDGAES